jgi:hypothetical protein
MMATCKDCLHYAVCADLADQFIKTFHDPSANGCENFKDRTKYMEVVHCGNCEHFHEAEQEWVSVKDRLPDVGCDVLFMCENKSYGVGAYSDTYRDFFSGQFPVKGVTHWMPLPEPPKEV